LSKFPFLSLVPETFSVNFGISPTVSRELSRFRLQLTYFTLRNSGNGAGITVRSDDSHVLPPASGRQGQSLGGNPIEATTAAPRSLLPLLLILLPAAQSICDVAGSLPTRDGASDYFEVSPLGHFDNSILPDTTMTNKREQERDRVSFPSPLHEYVTAKQVAQKRLVRRANTTTSASQSDCASVSSSKNHDANSSKSQQIDHRMSTSRTSVGSPSSSSTTTSPRCSTPSSTPDQDLILKVVLIGDSSVGKSNLVLRFAKNKYQPKTKQTVGFEFATKTVRVGERRFKAQVWDTAGQDRFQSLTAAYYRNAVGAMVVYDVTNRASFENVSKWLAQIHEHSHENLVMVLVGNKCDLAHVPHTRQVSTLEAARFAATHSMEFIETSALDATNVMDAFKKIIVPVGRLLSPTDHSHNIARLPQGWRRVLSRTRYVICNPIDLLASVDPGSLFRMCYQ
jgi:small GTP-binding protein